jgi:2,4-dienoyl-CoA reductase-like NADH-dependent reductase (Old Yellow Enzyme family)
MLLQTIEDHLKARRMTPTRFGREAVGDPMFVSNLRDGREPRPRTVARVLDYIDRSPRGRG